MTHEPIHYVPVNEQWYARILEELEGHPYANQWSRYDRVRLAGKLNALAGSGASSGPNDTLIPMAVDRIREVADWLPSAVGFAPVRMVDLLKSYVQPKSERGS